MNASITIQKINVTLTLEIRSHRTIGLRFFYKTYIMNNKEEILFLTELINKLRTERDSIKEEVSVLLAEINEQKKLN